MAESIIDIDDILNPLIEASVKSTKYKKVRALGMEVRVSTNPNVYTALNAMSGDPASVGRMVSSLLHPDDREPFGRLLQETDGIDADVVFAIIEKFSEATVERPTKSPADSSRGSTSKSVRTRKSAGD